MGTFNKAVNDKRSKAEPQREELPLPGLHYLCPSDSSFYGRSPVANNDSCCEFAYAWCRSSLKHSFQRVTAVVCSRPNACFLRESPLPSLVLILCVGRYSDQTSIPASTIGPAPTHSMLHWRRLRALPSRCTAARFTLTRATPDPSLSHVRLCMQCLQDYRSLARRGDNGYGARAGRAVGNLRGGGLWRRIAEQRAAATAARGRQSAGR